MPSFETTFSKDDKLPFGTYVAFQQMENIYPHNTIFVKDENFATLWRGTSDTGALYISICKDLFLTEADLRSMLQFVASGNSVFIASGQIDDKLLDSLRCKTSSTSDFSMLMPELLTNASVSLSPVLYNDVNRYGYFFFPFINRFVSYDSLNTQVLGFNQIIQPNFITMLHGKGRFFLHTEPAVFSNYFLLQNNNYKYLQQVFAYTKLMPEQVFWDDFYNGKRSEDDEGNSEGSSLDFLLKYPSLKWAFWLTLLLLFVYIFFGGKRRQRIIEVTEPNKNTTVAFTETVGRLYLQQHNNRNIADKVIAHFFDHIRSSYYLNTNHVNDIFIATLSRKSNVPIEKVKQLFTTIRNIQDNYDVTDKQLLTLNHQIENFNKTK
ncbi:DUF4350 domain-containing protein [Ferruginibacter sp. SUN002]|uniref:DUF4350 domain-containing protein n=1 Tax=Ferruginibacter sp. SUN002 TaxID=2937789 RepID=UPI003D3601A3